MLVVWTTEGSAPQLVAELPIAKLVIMIEEDESDQVICLQTLRPRPLDRARERPRRKTVGVDTLPVKMSEYFCFHRASTLLDS